MSVRYIKSFDTVYRDSLSLKTLSQIRKEFGAEVEPFTLHMPVPDLLAGAWMACRETLLAGNGNRNAKELVAATVSTLNRCPYCIDAHNIMLLESSGHRSSKLLAEPTLRNISNWASATSTPDSPLLLTHPFTEAEAPSFIGTAVFFHYINRMVTILLGQSPLPFSRGLPKKVSLHLAAWYFRRAIRTNKQQGASLNLLPEAELPDDLSWAKPSDSIAAAFARFAKAVENAGNRSLSKNVRTAVGNAIQNWNGSDPDTNEKWYENEIKRMDGAEKTAGRLAFLTAFNPYRVDQNTVRAFSEHFPGDDILISALAWSSFTAARKIGSWL